MTAALSLQDVIHLVEAEADDDQPLSRLQVAAALVQNLAELGDAALGHFVDQARRAGHSWSEIGESLGVSKQAAQQKHTVRLSLDLKSPTFQRFTPRARNVVAAAEPVAHEWGDIQIGPEHLFLALYREPDGLAAQILVESDLSLARAQAAVASRRECGPGAPEGRLSFSTKAKAVFSGALASALELGHNYIGTEHLLLGLLRGDDVASEVLADAGLTAEVLIRAVGEKLARHIGNRPPKSDTATQPPAATSGLRKASPTKKRSG